MNANSSAKNKVNCLITGFPGVGKSAVAGVLKKRGHKAYDPDKIRGSSHVISRVDGRRIHPPQEKPAGWYDEVGELAWDTNKLISLLNSDDDVFICSFAHNQADFYDLFDYIFIMTLDETELANRLLGRFGSHGIGKNPQEMSDIMKRHGHFESSLLNHGAIALDATKSPEWIVDQILIQINDNGPIS